MQNKIIRLIKYKDFETRFEIALKGNSFIEFIDELNELIRLKLNIYISHLFLARCYVKINNIPEARSHYEIALNLAKDPNWLSDELRNFNSLYGSGSKKENKITEILIPIDKVKPQSPEYDVRHNSSSFRSEASVFQNVIGLQKAKRYEEAFNVVDDALMQSLPIHFKAKLLLLKAQMSSASDKNELAIKTYSDLIEINLELNAKNSNLGHLYFEIAKIYARLNDYENAAQNADKAYKYTPTPIIANFLNTLKRNEIQDTEDDFSIDINDDQIDYVSPMLKFDIEDFDYRDSTIVKNGKVSIEDAERIYGIAQSNIKKDLSLVYPLYLEAAKAYNDLKPATYNYNNFIDALARYSAHKSNAIFYTYRLELSSLNADPSKLKRLKDSTCSYIETSLNLENDTRKLLFLLTNYLKVTISYLLYKQNGQNFKAILNIKFFNQVINYCIKHSNKEVVLKTHQAIIHFGSVSIKIWDRISRLSKDTGDFHNYLKSLSKINVKKEFVNQLNVSENIKVDYNLTVGQVFYRYIRNRKNQKETFENNFSKLRNILFIPKNVPSIIEKWTVIKDENDLFSETDLEISHAIDTILKYYLPYLDRTISERTNILYQVRTEIDSQLKFIFDNTTYWGRAMFYPLLKKWKSDINRLEKERVTQTIPILTAFTDPIYIFQKNDQYYVNLVIKNFGQSAASAFNLVLEASRLNGETITKIERSFDEEIIVNGLFPIEIQLSTDLVKSEKAIKLHVIISPFYQSRQIVQEPIEFTLEKETFSVLEIEDLPWNETKIPRQHLFKGREKLIKLLGNHYKSTNKDKTYILYGLTRTGKSSVLRYLEKDIEGQTIKVEGNEKKVITFFWDLSEASGQSNAQDLWAFLLYDSTISKIEGLITKGLLNTDVCPPINAKPRFKDWKKIIEHLNEQNFFPLFLIDEFAYYKLLHDNGRIDQSFLAAIRQYALNGLASFIFAGTYDLKELIKNSQYGITGQLTNTVEKLISNIDLEPATDLINVINDKLEFTPEAINHILFLSGRVPYFIQIICKNCGYYAVENHRSILGYPEVESVIKILIGEERPVSEDSLITVLSAGTFQNNQYSPTDNNEVQSLITSICFKNRYKVQPRGITYPELQELWSSRDISGFAPKLAEAISYLRDKEIIEEIDDESFTAYLIKVDIFRRWWENQHRDIDLELDILKEK